MNQETGQSRPNTRARLVKFVNWGSLTVIIVLMLFGEGWGGRFARVTNLAFSSDGKLLAVVRHDGHDIRMGRLRGHVGNVSRTISILNSSDGSLDHIATKQIKRSNQGPGFDLAYAGRHSVAFAPDDQTLLIQAFGGGDVQYYDLRERHRIDRKIKPKLPSYNMVVSPDQSLVAMSSQMATTIWDIQTDTQIYLLKMECLSLLNGCSVSFSPDNRLVALGGLHGVRIYDLRFGELTNDLTVPSSPGGIGLSTAPSRLWTLSDHRLVEYDLRSGITRSIGATGDYGFEISNDRRRIATYGWSGVNIYDLTRFTGLPTLTLPGLTTSVAFTSDSRQLAVSQDDGNVSLYDVATGARLWTCRAPGRWRPPKTIGLALLGVWLFIHLAIHMYRTHRGAALQQATPTTSDGPTTFCRECGYPLRGLANDTCPECGIAFNPGDPRTYATTPRSYGRQALRLAVGAWLVILGFVVVAVVWNPPWLVGRGAMLFPLVGLFVPPVLAICAMVVGLRSHRRHPMGSKIGFAGWTLGAALLVVLGTLLVWVATLA